MTARDPFEDIGSYTAEHGGGTFEASTGLPFEPTRGYAVARCKGTAARVKRADAVAIAARWVAREWVSTYVGTWLDANGWVHVDPVQYVADLTYALQVARERQQASIYSFAEHREIAVE